MDGIKTRILVISDTRGVDALPHIGGAKADVAIHCGDLTSQSLLSEFRSALKLLQSLDAPLKIVVAGGYDFTLDGPAFETRVRNAPRKPEPKLLLKQYGGQGEARRVLLEGDEARESGVVFLDEGTHDFALANGASLKVYASPYTPSAVDDGWAFAYRPSQGHRFDIPKDVDVVVTHGPPRGVLDMSASSGRMLGCPDLFAAVARSPPRLHCFGRVRWDWGARLVSWRNGSDASTSTVPSHRTDIENENSRVIERLADLLSRKDDRGEVILAKAEKRERYSRQGYVTIADQPVEAGKQTLFVNAAIRGVSEELPMHPAWLVDVDLPPSRGEDLWGSWEVLDRCAL